MPQPKYNLHLKGFVGGYDFDRDYVDYILAKNPGKPVNVLIDSTDGSLATALSISSAFKRHGDVSVHFVGLQAARRRVGAFRRHERLRSHHRFPGREARQHRHRRLVPRA